MIEDFKPADLKRHDAERLKRYGELLDFYHGLHWPGRERQNEKRLTFNYARTFIDKGTSYLMSGVRYAAEPTADSQAARQTAARVEERLYAVAEENNLEQLDLETETDCAVLGDACYKVIWDMESRRVRVTAPDVQGIHCWWMGDDTSKIWRVASRYSLDAETAESLYNVKPAGKSPAVTEVWTKGQFDLWLEDRRLESKGNPYGFIPFIIFPNLREPKKFWGVSDLAQIMEPQRELNRATAQLSRILELSGNPIAVLENVEESEDIAVRPGAVWNIPEEAKAYLLDLLQGGGVRLHIDYINLLFRVLHDLSESPRAAFGGTDRDLSGAALEIELQPLLQKVQRKRIIRTAAYLRRARLILRLLEQYTGEKLSDARLRIDWGTALPQDMSQLAANEQVLIQSGIHSRRRAMSETGVADPEMEFKQWLEERETILRMNRELGGSQRSGARVRAAEATPETTE